MASGSGSRDSFVNDTQPHLAPVATIAMAPHPWEGYPKAKPHPALTQIPRIKAALTQRHIAIRQSRVGNSQSIARDSVYPTVASPEGSALLCIPLALKMSSIMSDRASGACNSQPHACTCPRNRSARPALCHNRRKTRIWRQHGGWWPCVVCPTIRCESPVWI